MARTRAARPGGRRCSRPACWGRGRHGSGKRPGFLSGGYRRSQHSRGPQQRSQPCGGGVGGVGRVAGPVAPGPTSSRQKGYAGPSGSPAASHCAQPWVLKTALHSRCAGDLPPLSCVLFVCPQMPMPSVTAGNSSALLCHPRCSPSQQPATHRPP